MHVSLTAAGDDDGRRLDRVLRKALGEIPLSAIHRMLRKRAIQVNGKAAAAGSRIHTGDIICCNLSSKDFSQRHKGAEDTKGNQKF